MQKFLEQEADLLAETAKAFPPCAALVLVSVAREDFVEECVDVVQHGYFMSGGRHEGFCCYGWWGGGSGSGG